MPLLRNTARLTRLLLGQWYICLLLAAMVLGETWRIGRPANLASKGWLTHAAGSVATQLGAATPPPLPASQQVASLRRVPSRPASQPFPGLTTSVPLVGSLQPYASTVSVTDSDNVFWGHDKIQTITGNPADRYFVRCGTEVRSAGIWAAAFAVEETVFRFGPAANGSTNLSEYPAIPGASKHRRLILQSLLDGDNGASPLMTDAARALKRGDAIYTPHWPAIAHDAALLLATAGFLSGFWFVPRRKRYTLRNSRIRRGQCPNCAYDTTGLTDLCPECGESIA